MRFRAVLVTSAALVASLLLAGPSAAAPEVGRPAPAFRFEGAAQVFTSADYVGESARKKGVVVAWFPKAFTPGWTTELAALRDSAEQLAEFDVEVLYVSLDSAEKNAEFAEAMGTDTLVLSDPDGESARRFGVIGLGGLYAKRWTFYIDAQGILREIDKDVSPATAGQDIVRKLEALGFPRRAAAPAH